MSKQLHKLVMTLAITVALVGILIPPIALSAEQYTDIYIDYLDLEMDEPLDFDSFLEQLAAEDEYAFTRFMEAQYLMTLQTYAVMAYSLLMAEFLTEIDGNIDLVYPDCYAGAFIDHDTLVIQLTDISDRTTAFYWNIVGYDAPVVFKQVEFSLNQLIAFGTAFLEVIDAPHISSGFDTIRNSFSIVLYEGDQASIRFLEQFNTFSRFLAVPVTVELGERGGLDRLYGGSELFMWLDTGGRRSFSVGFSGTRQHLSERTPALLTSGHAFFGHSTGARVRSGGQEIGRLADMRFGPNSVGIPGTVNGDWAIVNLNSDGERLMTNRLRIGQTLISTHSTEVLPVGTSVYGVGMHNVWAGTVHAVNQAVTEGGVNIPPTRMTGMTLVNPTFGTSQGGDSGGTIWRVAGQNNALIGVHAGRTGGRFFFSPLVWKIHRFTPM